MKKKLLISLLSASAVTCLVATGTAMHVTSKKDASAEEWYLAEEIAEVMNYGETFTVPMCQIETETGVGQANGLLQYPNGVVSSDTTVVLDQAGIYTVSYTATVSGKSYLTTKTFRVEYPTYRVTSDKSTVNYVTEFGGNSEASPYFATKHNGLAVSLKKNDKLKFEKLIPVSELKKDNAIFSGYIMPEARGTADFNALIIRLTDSSDESKYLTLKVNRSQFSGSGLSFSWLLCGGNGQDLVGLEEKSPANIIHVNDKAGTPIYNVSFLAQTNPSGWSGASANYDSDRVPLKVSFDYATMSAYANNVFSTKLNDSAYYSDLWEGFTGENVKLEIYAEGYNSSTANFFVESILGSDLSAKSFVDEEAPELTIETEYEQLPDALVGAEYVLPNATAYDDFDHECKVNVSVWYNYTSQTPVLCTVKDGKFLPSKKGAYSIVYTSQDNFGNEKQKIYSFIADTELEEIQLTLSGTYPTTTKAGKVINVADCTAIGGSGNKKIVVVAKCGSEATEIKNGSFRPETAGNWTIEYTATDYVGQQKTTSYALTVENGEVECFENINLPLIYMSGVKYTLPMVYVNDYTSGKCEKKVCKVEVTDANGTKTYNSGDSFTPSVATNGNGVSVTYFYDTLRLETVVVPCVVVRSGDQVIKANYIYSTDMEVKAQAKNISVTAKENCEKCGWTYANPQSTRDFSFEFKTNSETSQYSGFEFVFTGSENPELKVTLQISIEGKKLIYTCGDFTTDVENDICANKDVAVTYKNGKIGFAGVNVAVKKYDNGEDFNGFGEKVFFTMNILNAQKDAGYTLTSMTNGILNRTNFDTFAPFLAILGNYGGSHSLGSDYVIVPATGCDAFAKETSVYLTVYDPKGNIVTAKDGTVLDGVMADKEYVINLAMYGNYNVTYKAVKEDWVSDAEYNSTNVFVPVIDEVGPTITWKGKSATEAKVGDVIVLPDFEVTDNISSVDNITVYKHVLTPGERTLLLEGESNSIKCLYEGKYTFIVLAIDEFGNTSIAYHTVIVSK